MTQRKTILPYLGQLSVVNGATDLYAGAHLMSRADEVVLQIPFGIRNNVIVMTDETPYFFQSIEIAKKPVWVRIDCKSDYTSANAAKLGILDRMNIYYNWFKDYRMLDYLKGFYLSRFGYEYSFNPSVQRSLTRQIQNDIVTEAHIKYELPVMVSAHYPSDVYSEIGPTHGIEDRDALWRSMIGWNPVIRDYIILINPLIQSWSDEVPSYYHSRIASFLATAKHFIDENVEIVCVQNFDIPTNDKDTLLGLSVNPNTVTILNDYAVFLRALGLGAIGAGMTDWGLDSNIMIDPEYLNNDPVIDNITGFSQLYTKSNKFYIYNPLLPANNSEVPATNVFNSSFHLLNGITPSGDIFQGPQGERGEPGEQGLPGPVGPPGPNNTSIEHVVVSSTPYIAAVSGDAGTISADCTLNYAQFIVTDPTTVIGKIYTFKKTDNSGHPLRVSVSGGLLIDGDTEKQLTTINQILRIQASPMGQWLVI